MGMAWDHSMEHLMGRRILQPKSHHCTLTLSFLSFHSCLSHTSSYRKTHFNHGETWQQMSVSILNLINGNDSSVIHLSRVAFLFFFFSLKEEWTPFGWRPSLLIAHISKAWCLGNIFLSVIRHRNHFLFVCDYSFCFWHLCLIKRSWMVYFPNPPCLTDKSAPF